MEILFSTSSVSTHDTQADVLMLLFSFKKTETYSVNFSASMFRQMKQLRLGFKNSFIFVYKRQQLLFLEKHLKKSTDIISASQSRLWATVQSVIQHCTWRKQTGRPNDSHFNPNCSESDWDIWLICEQHCCWSRIQSFNLDKRAAKWCSDLSWDEHASENVSVISGKESVNE